MVDSPSRLWRDPEHPTALLNRTTPLDTHDPFLIEPECPVVEAADGVVR